MTKKIAILGDFNPGYKTHHGLNDSIRHTRNHFRDDIQFDWIGTDIFPVATAFRKLYAGLWIAPGSPYKNMQNVLDAITYTREHDIPTFGNCGGFQHMIIEFARNKCGIVYADHEEIHPGASDLVISQLSCSLVEKEEKLTLLDTQSILYTIIKKKNLLGRYFCSYGVNAKYVNVLESHGLSFTAISSDNQVRAFELKSHPFFLGTLFQPALTSTPARPNPLIIEFVKRCFQKSKLQ
jgi:CTP synthase (UTP-ammonia lyase)